MTRTDQQVLTGTFVFALFALLSIAMIAPRFVDHLEPLPPQGAPRDEVAEPAAPVTPPPVSPGAPPVKSAPKLARRGKHPQTTTVAAHAVACGDDPLCGLDGLDE